MDREKLQRLRRKQRFYLNFFLSLYSGIIVGSILVLNVSRWGVYVLLGLSFLAAVLAQWMNKMSPITSLLNLKELDSWEREKLGETWRKYHLPNTILWVIVGVYFLMQARLYSGTTPFRYEIPLWYLIVIPVVLIFVANMNMTFHARRIDTKTTHELKQYSQEKMLFTKIFTVVVSVFIVIGFALVMWLRG